MVKWNAGTPGVHAPDVTHQLMAASGGDPSLAHQLAILFATDLVELLGDVRAANLSGDTASFKRAAHTLTGCAAALGFSQVAAAAQALERAARDGMIDNTAIAGDISRLAAACDEAGHAVSAYLGSYPPR